MAIQHSGMIHTVPRCSIVVAEKMAIFLACFLIKLVHVPLIAVTNSKEIQHCPETSKIQAEDLRKGYENDFIADTKNT
jgi:hypothetical protein